MLAPRLFLLGLVLLIAVAIGGCDWVPGWGKDFRTLAGPGGPAELTGRVTLATEETPAGAEVTVYDSDDYSTPLAQGRVRESGRFWVVALPNTPVDVVVTREEFFADKEAEIMLREGATALNDGEPISLASTAKHANGRLRYAPCSVVHTFKEGVSTEQAKDVATVLGGSIHQVSEFPFGVGITVSASCGGGRSMGEVMSWLIERGNRTPAIKVSHPNWLFYLH